MKIQYLFEDLLVIDAASFLAGPGAGTVLGDFGATVIKIEAPSGDRYRTLKGSYPVDYNWLLTSRNKKSIAIDLKTDEGIGLMHQLVAKADVFITNFIGDNLDRYQCEYDRLKDLNPRLIYAHVTGYGTKGKDIMRRSFDATAWWARSGLMEFVRNKDADPSVSAPGMGDHPTSISLFSGIVCGLYRRERTGQGAYITTSLVANGCWSNGMAIQGAIAGMDMSARKQATGIRSPFSHIYETKDGGYVLFSIVNAMREWPNVARALEHPEWLEDERFSTLPNLIENRLTLIEMAEEIIGKYTIDELLPILVEHDITHSYVQPTRQVIEDEQLFDNDILVDAEPGTEDYPFTVSSPIFIEGEPKRTPQRASDVGADTEYVLEEVLNLAKHDINRLIEQNVVFTERQTQT